MCLFSAVFALLCMPAAAKPAVPDVLVVPGDLPVVLTALHAGRVTHGRKDKRVCLPEHDLVCESGPCRTFGDRFLDVLAPAFQAQLGACLGGKPWFILMNVDRAFIDASRSVDDPGGPTCALAAPSDRQAYDQFFAAVDDAITDARRRGGDHALLIDIHTYRDSTDAPAPSLIVGTGRPMGSTIPRLLRDDPELATLFGVGGVRGRLLQAFQRVDRRTEIWPRSREELSEDLMVGRHLLKHSAERIDAMQLEVSGVVHDDPELTAFLAANALCAALAPRLACEAPAPTNDDQGMVQPGPRR